jgi:transcriptional regulator with XRE-family HTH domain
VNREPYQGAWVKQHRELLGLTQGELAEAVRDGGVRLSRSHLANIEAGMYAAPPELVRVVAALRGLDIQDSWRQVGTLARTRNDRRPTLHKVSQVADTGPAQITGFAGTPAPPSAGSPATELLDWTRNKLASLASERPQQVILTTTGPLADALRAAPPPGGLLSGILGNGIRSVLESGAELHHVLAVPDDPEAHFEVLANALTIAARYSLPPSLSRAHLSRYRLTLVPDSAAGPDLIAAHGRNRASLVMPVVTGGEPGITVIEADSPEDDSGTASDTWASRYASWLSRNGTELFSWVTVIPAGTLSMRSAPWEEQLTSAWQHAGGRDSIQRMLPLNTMSDELRSQLVAAQVRRRGSQAEPSVGQEVLRRLNMYQNRRNAMIRNLENGYSHRNIVTREALDDLVQYGQYTVEHLPDTVLTTEQTASYLEATIDLIRRYDNFQVLILADDQLEQALPLGVSWIIKRSPRSQPPGTERAWAFLPYTHNGELMAMNVVVDDKLAIDAIGRRIDALWTTWVEKRTPDEIRRETLLELEQAQQRLHAPA